MGEGFVAYEKYQIEKTDTESILYDSNNNPICNLGNENIDNELIGFFLFDHYLYKE